MYAEVVLRIITAAAPDLINLSFVFSHDLDSRANAGTIRLRPDSLDRDPVIIGRGIRAEQHRVIVDRIDNDIDISVIVEITERAATACSQFKQRAADLFSNVFKIAIVQVSVKYLTLRIPGLRFQLFHFGINMAVDEK